MKNELMTEKLTGAQKVAIFLMWLGEEEAGQIFSYFTDDEISQIAGCMTEMKSISSELLLHVLNEFSNDYHDCSKMIADGNAFFNNAIEKSVSKERAEKIYSALHKKKRGMPFSCLRQVKPEILSDLVKGEHPQTIALILAHLDSNAAADALVRLPADIQADVAMRIANIAYVPPELIDEIDRILQSEIARAGSAGIGNIDGLSTLAEILNKVDRNTEENIFTVFDEEAQEKANVVRQLMFVFEDILKTDSKGMREILKNIETRELIFALKTASGEMKEKVFASLSQRAAEMLREDMEVVGAVRLSQVEAAQRNIVRIARELESEGKIIIGASKEDIFV